uniref:Uncharacterized protein n=1 Tax=Arundo donax TaxID=35708 RepID=A0A0A9GJK7_ARUDO
MTTCVFFLLLNDGHRATRAICNRRWQVRLLCRGLPPSPQIRIAGVPVLYEIGHPTAIRTKNCATETTAGANLLTS